MDKTALEALLGRLIEGRKPKYHVSAAVAKVTATKADYIRMRAQDDVFYAKLLTDYLERFGQATRQEINQLLLPKLSDALDTQQKQTKSTTYSLSCDAEASLKTRVPIKPPGGVLQSKLQRKNSKCRVNHEAEIQKTGLPDQCR